MRWFIFIVIYILVDIYAFQALKTVAKSPWLHGLYVFISLAVLAGLIYELSFLGSAKMMEPPNMSLFQIDNNRVYVWRRHSPIFCWNIYESGRK